MARTGLAGFVLATILAGFPGPEVLAAVTITGDRVVGVTLLPPTMVDPKATFLRVDPADTGATAAVPFSLVTLGIVPGEAINLSAQGEFRAGAGLGDDATGTLALFSSSATLLDGTDLERVPGALAAQFVSLVTTGQTSSGLDTDIAEDFSGLNRVRVPAGATHLFFSVSDVTPGDNDDPDGDFGLAILRADAIGASGAGTLTVDGASTFSVNILELGRDTGSEGTASVSGDGARIEATGGISVGADGTGTLTVDGKGRVEAPFVTVARNASTGTVTVTGLDSEIAIENVAAPDGAQERIAASLRIGRNSGASGSVEVSAGGEIRVDGKSVPFPSIIIGEHAGSSGVLRVTGASSEARVTGATTSEPFIDVGQSGDGQLIVENQGQVNVVGPQAFMNISRHKDGGDPVTAAAIDENTGECTGTCVQVLSGGELSVTGTELNADPSLGALAGINIARETGSDAIVRVNGSGSKLSVEGAGSFINVGLDGRAEVRIESGGTVDPVFTNLGQNAGSDGRLVISGTDSALRLEGQDLESTQGAFMTVGRRGTGVAALSQGAEIEIRGSTGATSPGFQLGREDGSSGTVTMDGASRLTVVSDVEPDDFGRSGFIIVGRGGDGTLTVRGASTITNDAEGTFRVGGSLPGGNTPGSGLLTVSDSASRVDAGRQFLVSADPVVNGNDVSYVSSGVPGTAEVGTGSTIAAQIIQVGNGGTLRGHFGAYAGPVTAFDGGLVAPGTSADPIGDLTIGGALTLDGGTLEIEVAGPAFDGLTVTGAAALGAGTLVVKFIDGFPSSQEVQIPFLSAASIDVSGLQVRLEGLGTESASVQLTVQGGSLVAQVTGLATSPILTPILTPILQLLLDD